MKYRGILTVATLTTALAVSTFTLAAPAVNATQPTTDALTPAQVTQVQQIIRSYLVEHPEVLVAASEALQQKAMKKAEVKAKGAINQNLKQIFNDPHSPTIGNTKGKVTIVEFMDYQCGHCREMAPIVQKIIANDKNVRYVVKELPIFGNTSRYAAEIALAAYKTDPTKFAALHESLFQSKTPLTNQSILDAAKKAGYNPATLKKVAKDDKGILQQIKDNFQLAQTLGIIGTPTFIIGNQDGSNTSYVPGATTEANLTKLLQKAEG